MYAIGYLLKIFYLRIDDTSFESACYVCVITHFSVCVFDIVSNLYQNALTLYDTMFF